MAIVAWLCASILMLPVSAQQSWGGFDPLTADLAPQQLDPALFAYDPAVPLDVVVTEVVQLGDVQVDDLSYKSAGTGRVPAYLYRPVRLSDRPAPALVLMHGLPGSRGQLGRLARAYAQAGVWVLTISAPYARVDLPYRESVALLMGAPLFNDYDRTETVQVIADLRRAVDLIAATPGVDPARIGYVGFSMGGGFGAIMAAVEPRLKAVALMAPTSGLVTWVHTRARSHEIAQKLADLTAEARERWTRQMWEVEPARWLARAPSIPLLIQAGAQDSAVTRSDTERLASAAPQSARLQWYDTGHNLDARAYADQAAFLAGHLGFDHRRFVPPDRLFGR